MDVIDTSGLTVAVARNPAQGLAATALLDGSKDADLLVFGARGVGGFLGLPIGSVTIQVTHHAPCPVVVVPAWASPSNGLSQSGQLSRRSTHRVDTTP